MRYIRHTCQSWQLRHVRRRYIIVAMTASSRGALLHRTIILIILSFPVLRTDLDNFSHRFCSLMQAANGIIMRPTVCLIVQTSLFSMPTERSYTDNARGQRG